MEACQMPQCSIIVSGNKGSEFSYFGLIFQLELSRKPGSPIAKLAAIGEDAPRAAKGIGGAFPADIATLISASPADVHFTENNIKIFFLVKACYFIQRSKIWCH